MKYWISLFFAFAAALAHAEIFYVSQSGSGGSADGSSLDKAWSIASFNISANWGAGIGKIGAGDTVILNGLLTSEVTLQGSGVAGSPITILFAKDARFSKPTWTGGANVGRINASSKSYLVIDGGVNGKIEATDNGGSLGYQNDWRGCYFTSCDHILVQNLTFPNMYVRGYGDKNAYCVGIFFANVGSGCEVRNCTITYAFSLAYAWYQGTAGTSFTFKNNHVTYCADALAFGDGNSGSKWSGIYITGGYFDHCENWGDDSNAVHAEGIHLYAVNSSTSTISDISITGNYFGPYTSGVHTTAHVYLEGNILGSPLIANNVFVQLGGAYSPSCGSIYNKNSASTNIVNNTFSSDGSGLGVLASNPGTVAKNNIVNRLHDWYGRSTAISDYNCIYGNPTSTATEGVHSIIANPLLTADFKLGAGSPAVGKGVNVSGLITVDILGTARVAWDIGAYNSNAALPSVFPPTTAKITIQTN